MTTNAAALTATSARRRRIDYAPHVKAVADTLPEFCARAKIGRSTAFKLVREGKVRAVKLPGIGLRFPDPEAQARALYGLAA